MKLKQQVLTLLLVALLAGGCAVQPQIAPPATAPMSSIEASSSMAEQQSSAVESASAAPAQEEASSQAAPDAVQTPAAELPQSAPAAARLTPEQERLQALIYQEFAAGPPQKKFVYPVTKDWTSTVTNYNYNTPEQAHLSWKVSWILEGMDYAYKATGDALFLEESVRMYEALLTRRDDAEHRPAFDGTEYPLWGSTARYNGSFYTLKDAAGNAVARLQLRSEHNDQTYVAVDTNQQAATFTLSIKHKGKVYALSGLTVETLKKRVESEIGWTFYGSSRADKRVVEVVWLTDDSTALPATQGYQLVENTNVPTPVHTALILEPMTQTYLELKRTGHPKAAYFRDELRLMFDTLLQNNWEEQGFFCEMQNAPTFYNGGGIVPWNQQLPVVAAMALFAQAEDDAALKQTVRKAADYFMTKVTLSGGAYRWRYWEDPSKTVTYWETTNYGGIDLNSIRLIHSTGLAFSDTDMAHFTATVGKILKNPSAPATRIDGSSPSGGNLALVQKYLPFAGELPQLVPLVQQQTLPWDIAAKLLYFIQAPVSVLAVDD